AVVRRLVRLPVVQPAGGAGRDRQSARAGPLLQPVPPLSAGARPARRLVLVQRPILLALPPQPPPGGPPRHPDVARPLSLREVAVTVTGIKRSGGEHRLSHRRVDDDRFVPLGGTPCFATRVFGWRRSSPSLPCSATLPRRAS